MISFKYGEISDKNKCLWLSGSSLLSIPRDKTKHGHWLHSASMRHISETDFQKALDQVKTLFNTLYFNPG